MVEYYLDIISLGLYLCLSYFPKTCKGQEIITHNETLRHLSTSKGWNWVLEVKKKITWVSRERERERQLHWTFFAQRSETNLMRVARLFMSQLYQHACLQSIISLDNVLGLVRTKYQVRCYFGTKSFLLYCIWGSEQINQRKPIKESLFYGYYYIEVALF